MKLEALDVTGLDVVTVVPDLRRDIHVFVEYVRGREVKRAHRGNMLGKADAKRLAKLISDPGAVQEVEEQGYSAWLEYVDDIARLLGFVNYDTEGEYAGQSSVERSYPDNYIMYRAKPYEQFLQAKAAKQEATILDTLIHRGQGSASEFYLEGVLGRLGGFSTRASATGVMPLIDFTPVRRLLLGLLSECPCGQWLSTASLVGHLKKHDRYFLIPAKPKYKREWEAKSDRYGIFYEGKESWGESSTVRDQDPDGFERVEGRYIERFLEGLPLVLRYVDVAYGEPTRAIYPSLGSLKAFRVSDRLRRALAGSIAEPRVTVTPNFDVHVISETYPAGVIAQLGPLCETVSQGTSTVLRLTKQKVAAARAESPGLDAAAVLRALSGGELPANVVRELSAWSEHGEKFTLYVGCAVLEAEQDVPAADPFTVERIAEGIRLVRAGDALFDALERRELMPLRVAHGEQAFTPLPKGARTRFPKGPAAKEKPREPKPAVKLTRITRIQLVFPAREVLDKLHALLMEVQCPVEIDRAKLTLTYAKQYESAVATAIKQLKGEYRLEVEDVSF